MAELIFLDIASQTGCADGEIGAVPRLYTQTFARAGDHRWDGAGRAALWMAQRLQVSRPVAVYIEAPGRAMSFRGKTSAGTLLLLNDLATGCAAVCKNFGVPVYEVSVNTVRAWFLGDGRMPGDQAKREAARIARALGA